MMYLEKGLIPNLQIDPKIGRKSSVRDLWVVATPEAKNGPIILEVLNWLQEISPER